MGNTTPTKHHVFTAFLRPKQGQLALFLLTLTVVITVAIRLTTVTNTLSGVESFSYLYYKILAFLSLFSMYAFLVVWVHIFYEEKQSDVEVEDWCLPCFILAIACWIMPYLFTTLFVHSTNWTEVELLNPQKKWDKIEPSVKIVQSIASCINNALILIGIPYLEFKDEVWERRLSWFQSSTFKYIVIVFTSFFFIVAGYSKFELTIVQSIDVYYSLITGILLCICMWKVFHERLFFTVNFREITIQFSPFNLLVIVTGVTIAYVLCSEVLKVTLTNQKLLTLSYIFDLIILWAGLIFSRHNSPQKSKFKAWLHYLVYKTDRHSLHNETTFQKGLEKWEAILYGIKTKSHYESEFNFFMLVSKDKSLINDHFKSLSSCKLSYLDIYLLSKIAFFTVFWEDDIDKKNNMFSRFEKHSKLQDVRFFEELRQTTVLQCESKSEFIHITETLFEFFKDAFFHRTDNSIIILKNIKANTQPCSLNYGVLMDDVETFLSYKENPNNTDFGSLRKRAYQLEGIFNSKEPINSKITTFNTERAPTNEQEITNAERVPTNEHEKANLLIKLERKELEYNRVNRGYI